MNPPGRGAEPGAPVGPVTVRLVELCTDTAARLRGAELRRQLTALAERLAEPRIRVAIGGQMNAGKSTLVNALLGQRLAATGATETTRLVTWFRYGTQNRVHVHRRDGSTRVLAATAGGAEDVRSQEGEDIASLTVETSNEVLSARHTIVDTPGLNALSHLDPDSLAALADADAVVYLMPHPGETDVEAIDAVRSWAGGLRLGAANVLGVLSRIDTLGGDEDPWPAATRVANHYARELEASLSDVLPVCGLLAETALGAEFTEADGRALRRLAAVDRFDVEAALTSVQEFQRWSESPVSDGDRRRLLGLLGLHGCRVAFELIDQGRHATQSLLDGLAERSGIAEVLERVETTFVAGADRLRASAGIAALDELGWSAEDDADRRVLQQLQVALDRLRLDPALRQVELATALIDVGRGRARLDSEDLARLKTLATGTCDAARVGLSPEAAPSVIAAAADAQIPRWRRLEARPSRALQRHARTARELCEHIYFAQLGPAEDIDATAPRPAPGR